MTDEVENYPGFPEPISGFELTDKMRQQAERFQAHIIDEEVTAIGLEGLCKIVETQENKYRAKALIVCTGAHPRLLNVPGKSVSPAAAYPTVLPATARSTETKWWQWSAEEIPPSKRGFS